jgi:multiple sugar transport system substrate-binding protein
MKTILKSTAWACIFAFPGLANAEAEIELQRFFGACEADYATVTDIDAAVGECGIITAMVNKFEADNPDVKVNVTTVEWPGYDQLTAQMASRSAPDVVSMHYSVISDYQSRGLLEPVDDVLSSAGIETSSFTQAGVDGVTKDGKMYGMPFDNWTMLWHVNMNLMNEAGLVNADGTPMLPTSADELYAQGAKFTAATGKPYLVQILANETAAYARVLYTYLAQQNSDFFDDPSKINLNTDEARAVVQLLKSIHEKGLTTQDMDYPAAVAGFSKGEGGIAVNGTWLIGGWVDQASKAGNALSDGYTVYPQPQLFGGRDATYADGHGWVLPTKERSAENLEATARLLKFFADNNYQWARNGHLPAVKSVFDMAEFKSLPHRGNIAEIAETGVPLPAEVLRQFTIQDIIGEEVGSAVHGHKSIDEALTDAEDRINDLLANL